MISLARQLALRREIEEEMGELAGAIGRRDDERSGMTHVRPHSDRTPEERERDSAAQRRRTQLRRAPCPDCGGPRPKHKRRCVACGRSRRVRQKAARWRRVHPVVQPCLDCGGLRPHNRSPRCPACLKQHVRRLRAAAQRRARERRGERERRATARAALRCCDCCGLIVGAPSTQQRRCSECREEHRRVRDRERQRRYQERLRAAKQRRAA